MRLLTPEFGPICFPGEKKSEKLVHETSFDVFLCCKTSALCSSIKIINMAQLNSISCLTKKLDSVTFFFFFNGRNFLYSLMLSLAFFISSGAHSEVWISGEELERGLKGRNYLYSFRFPPNY